MSKRTEEAGQSVASVTQLKGMLPKPEQTVSLDDMEVAIIRNANEIDLAIEKGLSDAKAGRTRSFDDSYIESLKKRIRNHGCFARHA